MFRWNSTGSELHPSLAKYRNTEGIDRREISNERTKRERTTSLSRWNVIKETKESLWLWFRSKLEVRRSNTFPGDKTWIPEISSSCNFRNGRIKILPRLFLEERPLCERETSVAREATNRNSAKNRQRVQDKLILISTVICNDVVYVAR